MKRNFDAENKDEKNRKIDALKKAYMFFKEWKHQIGPDTAYGLGRRLLEYEDYTNNRIAIRGDTKYDKMVSV